MSAYSMSAIIPSYNSARWIAEAVKSALAQTLKPSEIIVVDDGSTDETARVLDPYVKRGAVEYVFQQNAGVAAARNAAITRATGELIAFLDADDVWHPRKLELQQAVLSARPELAMLGSATYPWPGDLPEIAGAVSDAQVRFVSWSRLAVRNYFTTSSVVVRRSALGALGSAPFDPNLHGPEDYDLWLRVGERWETGNLNLPLTGYRSHLSGLGNQPETMRAGMSRILEKLDHGGAWKRTNVPLLRRKAHAYAHYSWAYMYGAAGWQRTALANVLRSLATYPIPFGADEIKLPGARVRLLAVILLRLMRLKSPERE